MRLVGNAAREQLQPARIHQLHEPRRRRDLSRRVQRSHRVGEVALRLAQVVRLGEALAGERLVGDLAGAAVAVGVVGARARRRPLEERAPGALRGGARVLAQQRGRPWGRRSPRRAPLDRAATISVSVTVLPDPVAPTISVWLPLSSAERDRDGPPARVGRRSRSLRQRTCAGVRAARRAPRRGRSRAREPAANGSTSSATPSPAVQHTRGEAQERRTASPHAGTLQ
jgi:hypothetical protein